MSSPPKSPLRSVVVIPARFASTRLPRKMLLKETGKPLIQHTYETAQTAVRPQRVIVATDHDELMAAIHQFGGEAVMTDPHAASGTDRVAEVARSLSEVDVIVNLQGDEPELPGAAIDRAVELLEEDPQAVMSTLAAPIRSRERLEDPACVKVVFDHRGEALYFSRSVIPHPRTWSDAHLAAEPPVFYQHIGLYAYRRDFLLRLAQLAPSPLEKLESLEQLRVLWNGHSIKVGVIEEAAKGIDTPADYEAFVRRLRQG
jgi:3-deoxy-manno-octulosonate cytidylyltransferase (CMP-KDO synthetase)